MNANEIIARASEDLDTWRVFSRADTERKAAEFSRIARECASELRSAIARGNVGTAEGSLLTMRHARKQALEMRRALTVLP